ncbi:MAG: CPBP family intramembrane metalloprotease [Gammaproteobacteria bacterium]|jgi:membrane protease YdiL (CAAX protease family)
MLLSLLAYVPFLAIALAAQWSDRDRVMRWVTFGLILALDALVALGGLLALLVGLIPRFRRLLVMAQPGLTAAAWNAFGLLLLGTALLAPVLLLPIVRRLLARLIPIDADSGVHATALALAVLVTGLNLSQLPLIGGLDTLAASSVQVPFLTLLVSNLPIGLFPLLGVGLFIRRTPRETWARLGLGRLAWRQVGLTVGLAVAILAFYYGVDWVWRTVDIKSYEMVDALGEVLYGGASGTWKALLVSLVAGVTEELFFRGAVQPRFGLLLTAVFFTAAHVQYGFTLAALEVLGGALALGWLRWRTNTTACILLHALYDVGALLIFPLLP